MWDLSEYRRWLAQAEHTLASAHRDAERALAQAERILTFVKGAMGDAGGA